MNRTATDKDRRNSKATLYMGMELSKAKWKLAFSMGGQKVRSVDVPGGSIADVLRAVAQTKAKLGLAAETRVLSCYEAGRDGFWIHRAVVAAGIENVVVDAASIEVDRRARRAKTDRLDAKKLVQQLVRHDELGDRLRTVRVPTAEQEDARRPLRELKRLKKERSAHQARIRSLLTLHGIRQTKLGNGFGAIVSKMRQPNGEPLSEHLVEELQREAERLEVVREQVWGLERAQTKRIDEPGGAAAKIAAQLMGLKAIGPNAATVLSYEFFSWRKFENGKQVGACAGLTGTPYDSGSTSREQGISKAGNRHVRGIMIEIAWQWLRYQRYSRLTRWYEKRFATNGGRSRRVGIVALARKLLVALWRYTDQGIVPDGALVKA